MERSRFLSLIPREDQYDPEDFGSLQDFVDAAYHEAWHLDETSREGHQAIKHVVPMLLFTKEEVDAMKSDDARKLYEGIYERIEERLIDNGWGDVWE